MRKGISGATSARSERASERADRFLPVSGTFSSRVLNANRPPSMSRQTGDVYATPSDYERSRAGATFGLAESFRMSLENSKEFWKYFHTRMDTRARYESLLSLVARLNVGARRIALPRMLIQRVARFCLKRGESWLVDSRVERHSGFVFKPENHVQRVLAGWSYVARQFGRSSLHHADVHQRYCKKSNIARVKSDALLFVG